MGLPKGVRLSRATDFARVRAEGRSFPGRFVLLSIVSGAAEGSWKVGLITPRKLGNAVMRNRIRRRLRELVRAETPRLREGQWIVIVARWRSPQATFAELKRDWLAVAGRAGIFASSP